MIHRGKISKLNLAMWRQTVVIMFLLYLMVKSVNGAIKRNRRLVNEVSVSNFPSTGNTQLLTPNKSKPKVVILSDSHLKGCIERIHNYLSDKFRTIGWIKPGSIS
jgi:hypothetical protein